MGIWSDQKVGAGKLEAAKIAANIEAERRPPLTVNQLTFGELFDLCFKIVVAVRLSILIIAIPLGLIAWGIEWAVTH